jgi:hypothetical protein
MAHDPLPFDDSMRADPYPAYQRLRSSDPVHWNDELGAWFLTRYDDVSAGLRDLRLSANRAGPLEKLANSPDLAPFFRFLGNRMLLTDPPRHTRLRSLVNKAFTPRAVEARGPHIQQVVDSLLDRVLPTGKMDVVADLAFPLPAIVIAEMLGLPPEDRDRLKAWSDAFVVYFTKPPAQVTHEDYARGIWGMNEMSAYVREIIAKRRLEPRDDLLSALVHAEESGDQLTEEELVANVNLLLIAGHETTTGWIGSGVLSLVRHPEQLERVRRNPELVATAIEELLRYDTPVHFTHRIALEDMEVGGKTIRAGQWVHLVLAAANRDPEQFPEPDQLDIARSPNHHVGFGAGHHFCLGAPLARLEVTIAFSTLLRQTNQWRLLTDEVPFNDSFNARGPRKLPVSFQVI